MHRVAHRDIKSANILCLHERPTDCGAIKLADFGFAVEVESVAHASLKDNCGTLEYYAPELCENVRRSPAAMIPSSSAQAFLSLSLVGE